PGRVWPSALCFRSGRSRDATPEFPRTRTACSPRKPEAGPAGPAGLYLDSRSLPSAPNQDASMRKSMDAPRRGAIEPAAPADCGCMIEVAASSPTLNSGPLETPYSSAPISGFAGRVPPSMSVGTEERTTALSMAPVAPEFKCRSPVEGLRNQLAVWLAVVAKRLPAASGDEPP